MLVSDYRINEDNAWSNTNRLSLFLFQIIENLLKASPESKSAILSWIGKCLQHNKGRTGEISKYGGSEHLYSNTGMFVNLATVLIKISLKMFRKSTESKMEKIKSKFLKNPLNLHGFEDETSIVPMDVEYLRLEVDPQNILLNEIFFMTHIAMDMGLNQAHVEKKNIENITNDLKDCEETLKKATGVNIGVFYKKIEMTANGPTYKKFFIKDEIELKKVMNHYWKKSRCLRTILINRDLREHLNEFLNVTLGSENFLK